MTERMRQAAWKTGANNRDNWRNVPDDALRDAINVDVNRDQSLSLREGYSCVYSGTRVRGALAIDGQLLIADGADLMVLDTRTASAKLIGQIAEGGRFAGAVHGDELFFCTENQTLRYGPNGLRRWGVPTVTRQPVPELVRGAMVPGIYQVTMTWLDAHGDEGGATGALKISVGLGQGLAVTLPTLEGHTPLLYVSSANGTTLYLQASGAGRHVVTAVHSDTARLETMHLREPLPGNHVASYNAVLAIADDATVWLTEPMRAHLVNRAKRFFQYSAPVGFVAAGASGLIVSADKTYLLSLPETGEPSQSELLPYPGVPGTCTALPDGRMAWMTQYGLAAEVPGGGAQLIGDQNFVPAGAEAGAAVVLESAGNQRLVTAMKPSAESNSLAVSDHYDVEIVLNDQ